MGRQNVNMLIRGVVTAVCLVRNQFNLTIVFLFYFQQFVFIPFSLLCNSIFSNELRIHNFSVFRTIILFLSIFLQLLIFRMQWTPRLFLKCSFHKWKPFCSICYLDSKSCFAKMAIKWQLWLIWNLISENQIFSSNGIRNFQQQLNGP